jgi:hypothetical protein
MLDVRLALSLSVDGLYIGITWSDFSATLEPEAEHRRHGATADGLRSPLSLIFGVVYPTGLLPSTFASCPIQIKCTTASRVSRSRYLTIHPIRSLSYGVDLVAVDPVFGGDRPTSKRSTPYNSCDRGLPFTSPIISLAEASESSLPP